MSQPVHLFVFDSLADWEPGFVVAGLNNPEGQKVPGRYRVLTVALTRGPITTIGGVRIQPDLSLDQIEPSASAMLVLPGGDTWDRGGNLEAVEKAKAFLAAGTPVAAICARRRGSPGAVCSIPEDTPAMHPNISQRRGIAVPICISSRTW